MVCVPCHVSPPEIRTVVFPFRLRTTSGFSHGTVLLPQVLHTAQPANSIFASLQFAMSGTAELHPHGGAPCPLTSLTPKSQAAEYQIPAFLLSSSFSASQSVQSLKKTLSIAYLRNCSSQQLCSMRNCHFTAAASSGTPVRRSVHRQQLKQKL